MVAYNIIVLKKWEI